MIDYKTIFDKVESTLIRIGSQNLSVDKILENLNEFKKLEGKTFSDRDYYQILVYVVFYSGFKAATVTAKLDLIRHYFPNHEAVAEYSDEKIQEILSDTKMIKNRRKIQSCVDIAKIVKTISREYGSFQAYINSFKPTTSFENLMLLKEELETRFKGKGLGKVTTYHFLTDIGMPVLKPDRVICRIFTRLGLIENNEQLLEAIIQGRNFAKATNQPIRYIDIVFVTYGQMESKEFGITRGICLENCPACLLCGVRDFCNYFKGVSKTCS